MGEPQQTSQSTLRAISEVVSLTLLAFVIALVAGAVFIVPLVVLGYDIQTTFTLVGSTAAGQVGMFGVGYVYARYRDIPIPLRTPSRSDLGYVVGGVIIALIAAVGLSVILSAFNLLPESVIGEAATTNPTFLLGLAALSVVLVAPVEEFLFRGVIQGRLRHRFGPIPAVGGASLLFGSLHLANYAGNPITVVAGALMIAVVGVVFGTVYERTNNLTIPIIVHASYNVILLLTSYVALSYT